MRLSRKTFIKATGLGVPAFAPFAPALAADTFTLRVSLAEAANSAAGASALQFARNVARRSNDQIKIEVYPSLQLAPESATADALASGVIDFSMQSSAFLSQLYPRWQIWSVPFLFRNAATGFKVLDGPIGDNFLAELEPKGILGLGWGVAGFREIETTSRAVTVPEDMKGLRMRILSGAIFAQTFQALGAIPVAIDFAETYTALTQKTVDGMDVNLDGFTTGKYYNVVKHVAMSHHVLSLLPLVASKRKIMALPAPFQRIIREEAKALIPVWRRLTAKQTAEDVEILKNNGVAISEIQYPAFRKVMEPIYAGVASRFGADLFDRIARASA